MIEILTAIILFGIFFILLFLGFKVAFNIALSSFIAVTFYLIANNGSWGNLQYISEDFVSALSDVGQGLGAGIESQALLAIPLFVVAGSIMNRGGIANRLINLAKVIFAPVPGILAIANIVANTLFGALAGIASAAAIAVGGTIAPHAKKEKYDAGFMAAINAASAPAGLIIPPSGALILFSLYTNGKAPIEALFIGGYLPGLLWGLAVLVPAIIYATIKKYPTSPYPAFKVIIKTIIDAAMPIGLIMLIIGGIIMGWYTAIEASAMAVVFSIIFSLIFREMKLADIPKAFIDSIIPTSIATFLVATSFIMAKILAYASIPQLITDLLLMASDNPIILLILINIMLLIIGTFLDLTPALIIFTPILFPIVTSAPIYMDPVHFGIMIVFNLSIGLITPPVGTLLFVACSIAEIPFQRIIKPIIIPVFLLIITVFAITFLPEISLYFPKLLGIYNP